MASVEERNEEIRVKAAEATAKAARDAELARREAVAQGQARALEGALPPLVRSV